MTTNEIMYIYHHVHVTVELSRIFLFQINKKNETVFGKVTPQKEKM